MNASLSILTVAVFAFVRMELDIIFLFALGLVGLITLEMRDLWFYYHSKIIARKMRMNWFL
jgi:hypothetical protein